MNEQINDLKPKRKRTTEKQVEEALRKSGGFVTYASKALGLSMGAVTLRVQKSPYLQSVKKEIEESMLDLAEAALIKNVKEGDNASVFFYLKCKGKDRGYVERQEVSGDLNITVKHVKESM